VQAPGGSAVSTPKSARSRRTVPLLDTCVSALNEHRRRHDEERASADLWLGATGADALVFTTPAGRALDPTSFTRYVQDRCRQATGRHLRLHDLRHSCVTLLLAFGVPPRVVMEIAGHSAIDMTMNVYGHVNLDMQHAALAKLDAAITGDAPVPREVSKP
jgi:integrase